MKVLILNGSPKAKGGVSRYFSKVLKRSLWGCEITEVDVNSKQGFTKALKALGDVDSVVLSVPLYVDGIPSHLIPFLKEAEVLCKEKNFRFNLYVMSNGGFVEGVQNKSHLNMYEAWCRRTNIQWGGGLGIGGGVMLRVMSILLPIFLIWSAIGIYSVMKANGTIGLRQIFENCIGVLVVLGLSSGAYWCEGRLAAAIRRGRVIRNSYTRVMVPSFIFLIVADVFMFITALLSGKGIFSLFKKSPYQLEDKVSNMNITGGSKNIRV